MIELKNVTYGYTDKEVLHNVSVRFDTGGMYAIMGANGCGKTTLLRLVAGLLSPHSGEVTVEGKSVKQYSAIQLARRMAYVRQYPQTDFEFSAFETVLMGRNPYQRRLQNESQRDWDIVEQCMKQTNTWHLRLAKPAEMSGGEMQRVMIARALAQQTPVLLMDEPVSNLDIAHQLEIMRLLRTTDKTVVIVIHDLNLALQFCDDLMLIHNGALLFHGRMADGLTTENIATAYGVKSHMAEGRIIFDY